MGNKFENLVEETVVEVAPVAAIAARAVGNVGRKLARGVIGAKPTPEQARAAADAGAKAASASSKNRKTTSYKKYAKISGNKVSRAKADKDWLNTSKRDALARHDKQIIRNNKGTGGSNVVTSGNKTTNHTSNYNQVRKKDLQVYSATKQGQPPVEDDKKDNPLVTNSIENKQGTTGSGKSPSKTAVNGKFKAKVQSRSGPSTAEPAHVNKPKNGPSDATPAHVNTGRKSGPSTAEPAHVNKPKNGPSTAEPAHATTGGKFKAKVQSRSGPSTAEPAHVTKPKTDDKSTKTQGSTARKVASGARNLTSNVANVLMKHLS